MILHVEMLEEIVQNDAKCQVSTLSIPKNVILDSRKVKQYQV